ncbi:MAG: vWA domain-containing protein, partial [Nitrosopumilaceae archaeon]
PEPQVIIPLPRKQNEKYVFEGMIFENTENGQCDLWSLFLASVYYLAAHTAVSEYSIYDKWRKNKTPEICWKVIDFIEDTVAEKYLSTTNSDVLNNIKKINSILIEKYKNNNTKSSTNIKNKFSALYLAENQKRIDKIKEEILLKRGGADHNQNMLACADMLYKNRELLPQRVLPYCEHHDTLETVTFEKNSMNFQPQGLFEEDVIIHEELWNAEQENKEIMLKRYKKHLRDLNFDGIVIPSGDINAYMKIKSQNNVLLRKIRDGIRMVTNTQDDPRIREVGIINMQYAIQAIASESNTVEIFEQDEVRRSEEAWLILLDCSGSMKLKFNKMKEFALCVAETANELTGRSDAWSLYGFDSKLTIIKDFKENYSQEVKARVGALKNGGLSFVPDAIEFGKRMLAEDTRERKYLFVITDGQPSGDDKFDKRLEKLVKNIGMSDVGIIGVGIGSNFTKFFNNNCNGSNLQDMVTKFIKTYRDAAADM